MSKTGRNDSCPCGSGKKYKRCYPSNPFSRWKANADIILEHEEKAVQIKAIFFSLLEYIEQKQWRGACHATSSVLYVLFNEIGLATVLCAGEVLFERGYFDHSWVEINGEIYDVASYLAYDGQMSYPPVIKGLDIQAMETYSAIYGCVSPHGIDAITQTILASTVTTYMDNFPESQNGLWDLAVSIGKKAGIILDLNDMKEKYQTAKWTLMRQEGGDRP